jgi:hypothetical protein
MDNLETKLAMIGRHIERALAGIRADSASPVLVAVVEEFGRKAKRAAGQLAGADAITSRSLVCEVEQAGDSAKVAAGADTALKPETRALVDLAHDSICMLKFETKPQG